MDLRFSEVFLKVLEFSRDEALRTGWHSVCPDHIVLGIMRHATCAECTVLERSGVSLAEMKSKLDGAIFAEEQVAWEDRDSVQLSDGSRTLIQNASLEALKCGAAAIEPLHFLLAVCRLPGSFTHDFLESRGITPRTLVEASGLPWDRYGLDKSPSPVMPAPGTPDPALMAAAIEQRLREGYTTDNPHIS